VRAMKPESLNQLETPPAGVEAAGASAAREPAAEPRVKAPERADEARIWTEFVEEEKMKYVISLKTREEEYTLLLRKIFFPLFPYANYVEHRWEIEWTGGDVIVVKFKEIRDSWGGTGAKVLAKVVVDMEIPETPWYFRVEELAEEIEREGVKNTIRKIVEEAGDNARFAIVGWEE